MIRTISQELRPTALQHQSIMDSLRKRDVVIDAYNKQVRASGVFNPSEYGDRIMSIQADSYDDIARVLDGGQMRRFQALVGRGLIGDAVAFEVDPTMVVVK